MTLARRLLGYFLAFSGVGFLLSKLATQQLDVIDVLVGIVFVGGGAHLSKRRKTAPTNGE